LHHHFPLFIDNSYHYQYNIKAWRVQLLIPEVLANSQLKIAYL